MAQFRNAILNTLRGKCVGRHEYNYRCFIHGYPKGFMYKGELHSPYERVSAVYELTQEEANSVGLDDFLFVLNEWKEIEPHVIKWLNQCQSMDEALGLIPNMHINDIPDFILDIRETEPYQRILTLIALNDIGE